MLQETAPIGKTRGVNDGIDRAERGARGANKLGRGSGAGEVAGATLDAGAGAPALRAHRLQALEACRIRPLSVQHQALVAGGQPARDRGADAGGASSDD